VTNYNSRMNLAGKASNRGYAMAALLVAMAVMAVMLTVAMPTWNQMIRRDKEEELIFRGNQYARAINLYQRRFANASPPTIDVLVEQRLLRKKFRDPMSTEKSGEFQLLYVSNSAPSSRQGGASQLGVGSSSGIGSVLGTTPTGGIAGVTSKNKSESIRTFNGKNHYNEWQFVGMQQSAQGGAGGPGGAAGPGGRRGSIRPDGSFVGREGGRAVDTRGGGFGSGGGGRTGSGPGPGAPQGPGAGQGRGR
jgi:type II secretory pathway pseudopilin PulG